MYRLYTYTLILVLVFTSASLQATKISDDLLLSEQDAQTLRRGLHSLDNSLDAKRVIRELHEEGFFLNFLSYAYAWNLYDEKINPPEEKLKYKYIHKCNYVMYVPSENRVSKKEPSAEQSGKWVYLKKRSRKKIPYTFTNPGGMKGVNHGFVATLNHCGDTVLPKSDFTIKCIQYTAATRLPTLFVGMGYGADAYEALQAGATVIANDIEEQNLSNLWTLASKEQKSRLFLSKEKFPSSLELPENSLSAISVRYVFQYLSGDEVKTGLEKILKWLKPGHKACIETLTIHSDPFSKLKLQYEKRRLQGKPWAGDFPEQHIRHAYEEVELRQASEFAGFIVERAGYFNLDGSKTRKDDGLGLIIRKPTHLEALYVKQFHKVWDIK